MLVQNLSADLLAQVSLRFAVTPQVSRKLDDVEIQMVERRTHAIKPVLGFHSELIKAVRMRSLFLLLSQSAIPALAAPFLASAANPAVKDSPIGELDHVAKLGNQL